MRLRAPKAGGFTLIELMVVISIVLIVGTYGLLAYRDFGRRQVVTQAAEQVRTVLVRTRQRALSGERPTGCSGPLSAYQFTYTNNQATYSVGPICQTSPSPETASLDPEHPSSPSVVFIQSGSSPCPTSFKFNVLGNGTSLSSDCTITVSGYSGSITASLTVKTSGSLQ